MAGIVVELSRQRKRFLCRKYPKSGGWRFKRNILIILAAAEGKKVEEVADWFKLHRSSVWRIKQRFLQDGHRGLRDSRCLRGPPKATAEVAQILVELVRASPVRFGYARATWTRALLAEELYSRTGTRLSVTTVGRLLARIGAGWNRARPVVKCPWPEDKRKERLQEISDMLAGLPPGEIALFEDEVEIHLNPKIGFDWMMRAEQKEVVTPGQNQKGYLAGALEPVRDELVWVRGDRKDSALFISLLRQIASVCRDYMRIHLILDNYCIHKSKATRKELERLGGKIRLHFLPPYCPQANKMELVWLHLHRNVTCNHGCSEIGELMDRAENYLTSQRRSASTPLRAAA